MKYAWSKLNHLQKGTYGEYMAKMEFSMYGFSVFTSEVDDRGIDFVLRNNRGQHFDVQVKTITGTNYTYITESKFDENLIICLVILTEGEQPSMYILTGSDWKNDKSGLLSQKHFPNAKEPEYGINATKSRVEQLEKYRFENVVGMFE